jgi:cytochrome c oxidase accessory protein FixG
MCPWPRFQAALLDEDSYVVAYQKWRGEPRAPLKKNPDWRERGDCIACNQCVAVCPVGIDIRDGLQLECIGCGLCIDACNDVMARIGRPRELITLDTERNQMLRAAGLAPVHRIVRPRTIIYAAIVLVIASVILFGLSARASLDINILPERNPLFVTLSDGGIRNGYTIKILNKSRDEQRYDLAVAGLEGASLAVIGQPEGAPAALLAKPDAVTSYRVYVTAPLAAIDGDAVDMTVVLTDRATGAATRHETVFRGPA